MKRLLIVSDSSDSKKGGVPAFNQRFASAAAKKYETYMLIPASDNTQTIEDIAKDHRGVRVAMVPNPHTPEDMKNNEEVLALLLNEFVFTIPSDAVQQVPTLCVTEGGEKVTGHLPHGAHLVGGVDIVIGHSRFSGLAPGSITRGRRTSYEERHEAEKAWYRYAKYVHIVHMEVERLGLVKKEPAGKRWLKILFETVSMMDADVIACAGRGSFEWVWQYREAARISLPSPGINARLHELVPGSSSFTKPVPAPTPATLNLLLIGRASDKTKDAEGAFEMVRKMAPELDNVPPKSPYPAHLTVLGMPQGQVETWQLRANDATNLPGAKPEDRMVTIEQYGPPAKVVAEINKAHAVIIPSLSEAFSLVSFEALQQGKPAVTTFNNGFGRFLLDPDRVDPAVGPDFVVQDQALQGQDRIDAWAQRLTDLKNDLARYYEKTKMLQDTLSHYSWENTVAGIVAAVDVNYDSKQTKDGEVMRTAAPASGLSESDENDPWDQWWSL
ncbi:hypothetical protein ACTPOK_13735 [Streptomyces inhibens]|uniref:hypothetical protein n=1 Tax=Streptomyces inhibens TaxID=2293571 RepID=UPI00402A9531